MILVGVGVALITLFFGFASWIFANRRDIADPDTSDLVLDTNEIPDVNNAYICFKKAFDLSVFPEDARVDLMLAGDTWDDAFITDLLSRNAEALAEIRRGLACSVYQRREPPVPVASKARWQWLELSKLLILKSMHERRTNQIEQAWETCCGLLHFGSLIVAHPGGVIDWAVGAKIVEQGLTQAGQLLRESAPDETQLLRLSKELSRIGPLQQGWPRAVKAEFLLVSEEAGRWANRRSALRWLDGYWYHPNRTENAFAQFCRMMIENASRPYAEMHLPGAARECSLPLLRPNEIGERILPAPDYLNRFLTRKCEVQSHLDGLRLVIACRLHEIRRGQLPTGLDELVPELLEAVPVDPFDGKPFRYSCEDAVVYSVGEDLTDSWNSGEHTPDVLLSRDMAGKMGDLVYSIRVPTKQGPKQA